MSQGKLELEKATGELVQATVTLMSGAAINPATAKPYTLHEAEGVVCQATMDLYAWLLAAVADSSPWPDPNAPVTPPVPVPTPLPPVLPKFPAPPTV